MISVQTNANNNHAPNPYITTLDPLLAEIAKQSWKVTIVKIIICPKSKNAIILAIGGVSPIDVMKYKPAICAKNAATPTTYVRPRAFPNTIVSGFTGLASNMFIVLSCLSLWKLSTETAMAAIDPIMNVK